MERDAKGSVARGMEDTNGEWSWGGLKRKAWSSKSREDTISGATVERKALDEKRRGRRGRESWHMLPEEKRHGKEMRKPVHGAPHGPKPNVMRRTEGRGTETVDRGRMTPYRQGMIDHRCGLPSAGAHGRSEGKPSVGPRAQASRGGERSSWRKTVRRKSQRTSSNVALTLGGLD